jgi:ABC-type multidrug transport system fused ATPase/permease subunit
LIFVIKLLFSERSFIASFIGRKIIWTALFSILLSGLMFLLDLIFAFSLQLFLHVLGLASLTPSNFLALINRYLPYITSSLNGVLVIFVIVGSLRALFVWMQSYLNGMLNVSFETKTRIRIISWAFEINNAKVADVANLFNEKATGAGSFLSSFVTILTRILLASLLLYALFNLSMKLTIMCVFFLALVIFPLKMISRKISLESKQLHSSLDQSIDRLLVGVKNSLFLHISGVKTLEKLLTISQLDNYLRGYKKYFFFSGMKSTIPQILGIYLICTIAYLAKSEALLGAGIAVQYLYLSLRFVQALGELANLGSYLSLTFPQLKTLYEWYKLSYIQSDNYETNLHSSDKFDTPLGFNIKNLSFSYSVQSPIVLKNIDVALRPSSILVITGESGVGKSTLLHILVGLLKGYKGKISLVQGAKTFDSWDERKLLNSIGYVGPEPFIIAGTIKDNLLYGNSRLDVSREDIENAIILSNSKFIYDLPNKLNYKLTEQGEGLSAGQKQRLAIARAILRKPSILLLDEATSNLDSVTERAVIRSLSRIKKFMTIICITHRESLLKIADQHVNLEKN